MKTGLELARKLGKMEDQSIRQYKYYQYKIDQQSQKLGGAMFLIEELLAILTDEQKQTPIAQQAQEFLER